MAGDQLAENRSGDRTVVVVVSALASRKNTRPSCAVCLSLLYVMVEHFTSPVLSLAKDAIKDLDGNDALPGLWTGTSPRSPQLFFFDDPFLLFSLFTVFTKCKESLQDGRRLENISWRLWYRELAAHTNTHRQLPTPPHDPLPQYPLTPVSEKGSSNRPGKFYCNFKPLLLLTPTPSSAIQGRVPTPHLRAKVARSVTVHLLLLRLGHQVHCQYDRSSRHRLVVDHALSAVAQHQNPLPWARSYAI